MESSEAVQQSEAVKKAAVKRKRNKQVKSEAVKRIKIKMVTATRAVYCELDGSDEQKLELNFQRLCDKAVQLKCAKGRYSYFGGKEARKRKIDEYKKSASELYRGLNPPLFIINQIYNKALLVDPGNNEENSIIYFNKSIVCAKMNAMRSSIDHCSSAICLNGNYLKAYLRRGQLYSDVGLFYSSVRDYERVCELDNHTEYQQSLTKAKKCLEKIMTVGHRIPFTIVEIITWNKDLQRDLVINYRCSILSGECMISYKREGFLNEKSSIRRISKPKFLNTEVNWAPLEVEWQDENPCKVTRPLHAIIVDDDYIDVKREMGVQFRPVFNPPSVMIVDVKKHCLSDDGMPFSINRNDSIINLDLTPSILTEDVYECLSTATVKSIYFEVMFSLRFPFRQKRLYMSFPVIYEFIRVKPPQSSSFLC